MTRKALESPAPQGDWNPDLYLRFGGERTQPVIDLVQRLDLAKPRRILDIGCGPGNSTEVLAARWPSARITGIDSSPAMIGAARERLPDIDWRIARAEELTADGAYDLVFGNAVIHWIADHQRLLARLFRAVGPGGALALQVPLSSEMAIAGAIDRCWERLHSGERFPLARYLHYYPVEHYYAILGSLTERVTLWVTSYYHVLETSRQIFDMMRATRIRPYLEAFDDPNLQHEFTESLLRELAMVYPPQPDGRVLFPFKRLFMVARRPG